MMEKNSINDAVGIGEVVGMFAMVFSFLGVVSLDI